MTQRTGRGSHASGHGGSTGGSEAHTIPSAPPPLPRWCHCRQAKTGHWPRRFHRSKSRSWTRRLTSLSPCITSSSSPCRSTVVVPHVQFIDRVLDNPVMPQRQVRTVPNCAEERRDSSAQFLGMVLTRPLLCNDRCRGWSRQRCYRGSVAVAVYR